MAPQQSIDHHFVPQFYLKRWAGPDGKVCEFTRPHRELIVRPKTPKTTGYQKHLYTVPGLLPHRQSIIEDVVMRRLDQDASNALDFMLGNTTSDADMPNILRSGWSRFLMSLRVRSPQRLSVLKAIALKTFNERFPELELHYREMKDGSETESSEDVAKLLLGEFNDLTWAHILEGAMDDPTDGAFYDRMHWSIATIGNPEHHLLTSDHPLVMTNGIDHPQGYVIVPVGPTQIFIAVNSAEVAAKIEETDPRDLVRKINDKIARQAVDYVYDTDERQERFIANRFGRQRS